MFIVYIIYLGPGSKRDNLTANHINFRTLFLEVKGRWSIIIIARFEKTKVIVQIIIVISERSKLILDIIAITLLQNLRGQCNH